MKTTGKNYVETRKSRYSRKYQSTIDGRKNIAKNYGIQLKKFIMRHYSEELSRNLAIQKFVGGRDHTKQQFEQLALNIVGRSIAL